MSSLAEQGVANTVLSQPSQSKQPTEDTNHHVNGAIDPSPPMKETTPPPQLQSSSTATAPASEAGLGVSAITESTPESPIKVPFLAPLPDSKPPTKPELTPEQEQKYNDLLTTVSGWTEAPTKSAAGAPIAPLTEEERMWLTRDRLLQYLRAVKWVAAEAPKRLLATIVWRREYGADRLTGDYISPENETGKQVILGYDKAARPCLYLIPSKQNTKKTDRQVEHLVFMVERVLDVMVPGQETLSLLVNFNESRSGSVPNPGQGKQVLNILQTHYPERLGRALVINLPWFINGFFKLITPFIDPMTREKLKFNEDVRTHVPPPQLLTSMGGDVVFEYDHATYWPAMLKLAEERRSAFRERWVTGGKRIGENDGYLRGGEEKSVRETETATTVEAVPGGGGEKAVGRENGHVAEGAPDVAGLKIEG